MKPIHYAIATIGGGLVYVPCFDGTYVLPSEVTREFARVTCPDCLARLASISRGGA